jgi:hypothetical protein
MNCLYRESRRVRISPRFLEKNDGFDLSLPPHHNCDRHTCLSSLDLHFKKIVIAMDAYYEGGVTNKSDDWSEPFGRSTDPTPSNSTLAASYAR